MQALSLPIAGLWRRLGAMLYDTLLIVAVLMAATVPFLPFLHGRVLVPSEVGALAYIYWLWQLAVIVVFFGYFWTRRGQTVGMLAWRVRLECRDGSCIGWAGAVSRIAIALALLAPFFVGYPLIWERWADPRLRILATCVALAPAVIAHLWLLVDRDRLSLYDRWTHSRMVVLPKR